MQLRLEGHPIAYLIGLYACCLAIFLISIPMPHADGQLTGSDGAFYYAYLPALLIDHSLDFSNPYARLVSADFVKHTKHTATGRLPNKWAVGPAILWMPFFLVGHILAVTLKAAGFPVSPDGLGYVYQVPTLIGSLTYGFAGLLLIYRSCRRFFSRSSSASATILIWLATNVIYYMIAEPSMSHACSLFTVALFLELWLGFRPAPTFSQWVCLGMAGGLVTLVRLQDATWLALPVIDALLAFKSGRGALLLRQLKGFLGFGLAAGIVFMPQMAIWRVLNGSSTRIGYLQTKAFFHWFAPEILEVLFSLRHGLYLWHPVLLLATAGLILLYRKDRSLSLLLGLMFASQLYLVGAWSGWSGGDAFGGRLLISSFPALALGLAALVEWAVERSAQTAAVILSSSLIAWNALFFVQYRLRYISMRGAITFNQLTLGKLAMLKDIVRHIQAMLR
jgi:hypothetical protein